jgi:hypothetical protein
LSEDPELVVNLSGLPLVIKNLAEFVGTGAQLGFDPGHLAAGQGGAELKNTAPRQHHGNKQPGQPKGTLDRVTASQILGGLSFGEKVEANGHE